VGTMGGTTAGITMDTMGAITTLGIMMDTMGAITEATMEGITVGITEATLAMVAMALHLSAALRSVHCPLAEVIHTQYLILPHTQHPIRHLYHIQPDIHMKGIPISS
jgi:hypothetical protein